MKFSLSRSLTLIIQESEQLNSVSFRALSMLLSTTAHVLLYLSIGISHGERGDRFKEGTATQKNLTIHLLPQLPDSTESTQVAAEETPSKNMEDEQNNPAGELIGNPEETAKKMAPLFEVTLPPEPYYFTTDLLTEKPKVAQDLPPDLALSLGTAGARAAILRLRINENGEIDEVIVEDSNFSEEEKERIIAACKKMKFKPGRLDEMPVNTEMRIVLSIDSGAPASSKKAR
ncbi:energy transducer TonB [Undibacterium sp. TJN25]|uniref:energy transducer TonB n=1 Tax=Undibacterium sp. TJN25 TaxID=3413056 RepID=UPI003BF12CC9